MPNQSSSQRKRVASSQTDQTAPTQPKQERSKYLIQVTAVGGEGWEIVEVTPDELKDKVDDIVANGYRTMKDGRAILFPAVSLTKVVVSQ